MTEASEPAISRSCIEGLSDLIFGLALSIGAIELVVSSSSGTLKNSGFQRSDSKVQDYQKHNDPRGDPFLRICNSTILDCPH